MHWGRLSNIIRRTARYVPLYMGIFAIYQLIRVVSTDSSENVRSTDAGPRRTRRGDHRRTTQQPYPVQGGSKGPPAIAHRRAAIRQPAARGWPDCPRGGFPFSIHAPAARSAELVWDTNPLDAPSHSSHLAVARFLGLLTANLTDSATSACATQIQHAAHLLGNGTHAQSLRGTVEHCAAAFRSNDASNFTLMMRLIQLKSQISWYVNNLYKCS